LREQVFSIFSASSPAPVFGLKPLITTGTAVTAQYTNKKARGTFRKYSDMGDTKNGFSVAKEPYEKSFLFSICASFPHI
jgi:hypothetical protein